MPPQQQQQGGDHSLAALWIMVLLFIVLAIIWAYLKSYIIDGVFQLKIFEIYLVSFFTPKLDKYARWMANPPFDVVLGFHHILYFSGVVGDYLRYPFCGLLGLAGIWLCAGASALRFRTVYNMKKLIHSEKAIWPQIMPVADLDLVKQPLDEGPWAMTPIPMQFARQHKLLKIERKALTEGMLSRQSKPTATVIKGAAHRVFSLQMGSPWRGDLNQLNPHTLALFAIFAAKSEGNDKAARKLLTQISMSTANGKLDFNGVKQLAAKYSHAKPVQKVMSQHAYVLGLMASMLELARTDGVLAVADFLWLKPVDRPLWYMLVMVGRPTAVPEISGAFGHWLAEKELAQRLIVPQVDEAVTALDLAIKEVIYVPEDNDGS